MTQCKSLIFYLCLLLAACNNDNKKITYARIIRDASTTNKVFYPDGKLKLLITNRKGVLANIEYFNTKGSWDSIVDYKKGIRIQVVRFAYNSDGSYQRTVFKNETATLVQRFDKLHTLLYQEPINSSNLLKTKIRFNQKKNYLSKFHADTFQIINSSLPPGNRGYKFIGFSPRHLEGSYTSFITRPSDITAKDSVLVLLYLHEKNEHKQLIDTLLIPLK